MPFTFSHPVAALPFARFGLPLSALVIGSMAPDFPYFLQLSTGSRFGHSLIGIFAFCLPASLVALWLWHRVLDAPLRALLPMFFQFTSSQRFQFAPPCQFSLIILAIIIGAMTHIVWDSFTHANGFVVQRWPLLQTPLLQTSHGTIRLDKFLQHASSLLGAIVLLRIMIRPTAENLSHVVDLSFGR